MTNIKVEKKNVVTTLRVNVVGGDVNLDPINKHLLNTHL